MKSEVCANARLHVHHALLRAAGPQFRTAALRSNRQCGAAALRTRVPLRPLPAIVQKTGLLVQLDQTGQVLVTIVCNLLVACEQTSRPSSSTFFSRLKRMKVISPITLV